MLLPFLRINNMNGNEVLINIHNMCSVTFVENSEAIIKTVDGVIIHTPNIQKVKEYLETYSYSD